MQFSPALEKVTFVRRYKRFFADVVRKNGEELTVHCPNTGSMTSCIGEGWPALISDSQNDKRKLRYTLEMTYNGTTWIGLNTINGNRLAYEWLDAGLIKPLKGYTEIKKETKTKDGHRLDFLLSGHRRDEPDCYVEVKSVSLWQDGRYLFPDAVTERGHKHIDELLRLKRKGARAVMLFVVQREDAASFSVAADIDPEYNRRLVKAQGAGVEVLVYQANLGPKGIGFGKKIRHYPVKLA